MGRYKRLIWDALRDDPVVGRDARGILAGLGSEGMEPQEYYRPVARGFERQVIERMEWWDKKRRERRGE